MVVIWVLLMVATWLCSLLFTLGCLGFIWLDFVGVWCSCGCWFARVCCLDRFGWVWVFLSLSDGCCMSVSCVVILWFWVGFW